MEISAHVLTLPEAEASSLGELRLAEGIEVAEAAGIVWLRIATASQIAPETLLKIPARERRVLSADGKLYAAGKRLPEGRLPTGLQWTPLRDWLKIKSPKVSPPAKVVAKSDLRLKPGGELRDAAALLLELAAFEKYAAAASELRLSRGKFAVRADGYMLVLGTPIPSLPGTRFSVEEGIAVPLGWHWEPQLSAKVVAKLFKLRPDDLVLWESDEKCCIIRAEQWLPVTRGAVRVSLEGLE